MRQFHPLTVQSIDRETSDSMRVALRVPDELKGRMPNHVGHIAALPSKEIIKAYNLKSHRQQAAAQMGPEEAGATRNQNSKWPRRLVDL